MKTTASRRFLALAAAGAVATLTLAACSDDAETAAEDAASSVTSAATEATSSVAEHAGHDDHAADSGHEGHDHPLDGGPAPEGISEAADPKFPVGSEITVKADHMPGMEGAAGRVVGAFRTTTYAVTYTPEGGGEPVREHRWVVHEELVDPGQAPLADGTEVTLNAEHMSGMKGARATIDYSTQEDVYMVDVDADGTMLKNHKWVTESELAAR